MGTILTEIYKCEICGKKCKTDKLGYFQGMYSLWQYGSHNLKNGLPSHGKICTNCLKAFKQTLKKLRQKSLKYYLK